VKTTESTKNKPSWPSWASSWQPSPSSLPSIKKNNFVIQKKKKNNDRSCGEGTIVPHIQGYPQHTSTTTQKSPAHKKTKKEKKKKAKKKNKKGEQKQDIVTKKSHKNDIKGIKVNVPTWTHASLTTFYSFFFFFLFVCFFL
jgi:hypothetical protein